MDFHLYFKSRQGEMIHILKKMVGLESPTGDKKAVDSCSAFAVKELKRCGGRVVSYPQKDIGDLHLVEFAGAAVHKDKKPLLVLTHIDTVWPVGKSARMPFYISGDKIHGPGVLDMKAGLVMAVSALGALRNLNLSPSHTIWILINSAEETGDPDAHAVIRKLARKASAVLCLEPAVPGGALKMERKGRLVARLDVQGRTAHAGSPEKGVNAVEELMHQLFRLRKLRTQGTTMNIGCAGGGEKPNIVAGEAWAVLDFRFWKIRDKERIVETLKTLRPVFRRSKTKVSFESTTPPMEKTPGSLDLLKRARKIAGEIGLTLKAGKSGGGSDASIAAELGIPTLDGLGPDGDGIHADHEHLLLSSLVERTALLTELLLKL